MQRQAVKKGQPVIVFEGRRSFEFPSLSSAALFLTARGMLPMEKVKAMLDERAPLINGRQVAYPSSVEKSASVKTAKEKTDAKQLAKGLAKLIVGGGLAVGGARIGAPALRGLVRVGERTANGRFLNATRLGRLLKPFTRSALYGDDVARQARRNGVKHMFQGSVLDDQALRLDNMFDTLFSNGKVNSFMEKHLGKENFIRRMMRGEAVGNAERMSNYPNVLTKGDKGAVKFYGFMPKPKGGSGVGSVASDAERAFADNKVNQAELFKRLGLSDLMPQQLGADDIQKALSKAVEKDPVLAKRLKRNKYVSGNDLRDIIKKYLGKDVFIKELKNTAGRTESFGGAIPVSFGSDGKIVFRHSPNYMVQEAAPTRAFKGLGRELSFEGTKKQQDAARSKYLKDHPIKALYEKLHETVFRDTYSGKRIPRQSEYRVHAVNGKVVPFATSEKWDLAGYFNPFESRRKRRIEKAFQELLDRAEKSDDPFVRKFNLKNQVFGADVGIGPNGEPIFYELNPTMTSSEHYGSGQLNFPWIRNAITRAIEGRMSGAQKLQLIAGGAPAAGGTAMAVSGAGNLRGKRDF